MLPIEVTWHLEAKYVQNPALISEEDTPMGIIISTALNELGFICVASGMEYPGMRGSKGHRIEHGTPLTWDYNNGTSVVYDENGAPWVIRGSVPFYELKEKKGINIGAIRKGAYVPHSNDGGDWIRSHFEDPRLHRPQGSSANW